MHVMQEKNDASHELMHIMQEQIDACDARMIFFFFFFFFVYMDGHSSHLP